MQNDIKKSTTFNVGDIVRHKVGGILGTVENRNESGDRLRVSFQGEDSFWIDSCSVELVHTKKTVNIRSIRSLYKKAAYNPSPNRAEEKAIAFFDNLVQDCIEGKPLTDEKYDYSKEFEKYLKDIEKRTLQYYRKIRL